LSLLCGEQKGTIRRVKHWRTTLAVLAALSASLALADDFKTTNGKEYKNATVTRVEPDGIVIRFSGGIVKIAFTELPKEVQERFHYDPEKAAAAHATEMAAVQQTNQQIEEPNKQRRDEQKALANRLSELQQQEEQLATQIGQAGNAAAAQQADARADVRHLEKTAEEEAMTPKQKSWQNAQNQRAFLGARRAAARLGYDAAQVRPPRDGEVDYDPLREIREAKIQSGQQAPASNSREAELRLRLDKVHNEKERVRQEMERAKHQP
jgi:chromosome segregation ATPase